MSHKYEIFESDRFVDDVEEAAVWILQTNIDQSESLAEKKLDEFHGDISALKVRLRDFPESGEVDTVAGLRKFPVYEGRYSVKWIIDHSAKALTLVSLADSRYPQELREFVLYEE